MLKCKVCKFESSSLDEVCYYDINGWPHDTEQEIEQNAQNPDALTHALCTDCASEFNFEGDERIYGKHNNK